MNPNESLHFPGGNRRILFNGAVEIAFHRLLIDGRLHLGRGAGVLRRRRHEQTRHSNGQDCNKHSAHLRHLAIQTTGLTSESFRR